MGGEPTSNSSTHRMGYCSQFEGVRCRKILVERSHFSPESDVQISSQQNDMKLICMPQNGFTPLHHSTSFNHGRRQRKRNTRWYYQAPEIAEVPIMVQSIYTALEEKVAQIIVHDRGMAPVYPIPPRHTAMRWFTNSLITTRLLRYPGYPFMRA